MPRPRQTPAPPPREAISVRMPAALKAQVRARAAKEGRYLSKMVISLLLAGLWVYEILDQEIEHAKTST
jgi:hypothetical protein